MEHLFTIYVQHKLIYVQLRIEIIILRSSSNDVGPTIVAAILER